MHQLLDYGEWKCHISTVLWTLMRIRRKQGWLETGVWQLCGSENGSVTNHYTEHWCYKLMQNVNSFHWIAEDSLISEVYFWGVCFMSRTVCPIALPPAHKTILSSEVCVALGLLKCNTETDWTGWIMAVKAKRKMDRKEYHPNTGAFPSLLCTMPPPLLFSYAYNHRV